VISELNESKIGLGFTNSLILKGKAPWVVGRNFVDENFCSRFSDFFKGDTSNLVGLFDDLMD